MYKVSELISKPLISIYGAKECGIVGNIYFDSKLSRGKILSLFCEDENDVDIKYVELKKITSITFDAATIKNCDCITCHWNTLDIGTDDINLNLAPNPINCEVYNQDGRRLGTLKDITIDNQKVVSFTVDDVEYPYNTFLSQSCRLLILNDTGKPIKLNRPAFPTPPKDGKVLIAEFFKDKLKNNANNDLNDILLGKNNLEVNLSIVDSSVELPSKIPLSSTLVTHTPAIDITGNKYTFLMGKKLSTNIYNKRGLLFRANTIIDEKIIDAARGAGKLVQLALHATAEN